MRITDTSFVHSGRTDSSGGHRNNKNKSGLGYYHYHHGSFAHLHENGACPYDPVSTSASVRVKSIQNKLNEIGYDCGEADGEMGSKTKTAIKELQKEHRLAVE